MTLDVNSIAILISIVSIIGGGYVSIIRRIDKNKQDQALNDEKINGKLNDIQTQLRSMSQLVQMQIDSIQKELKEVKQWQKE